MAWLKARFFVVFGLYFLLIVSSSAFAVELAPYKDRLFGYPGIMDNAYNGDYLHIDYNKKRDLYGRDEVPERSVKRKYLKRGMRKYSFSQEFKYQGRNVEISFVSKPAIPKFAVLFIHGRNGDRRLGMYDLTFGGNFNRLKNLALNNGGIYLTQTVRDFSKGGLADARALVHYLYNEKKIKRIVIACGSMGSQICQGLARNSQDVQYLDGLILLGGIPDKGFLSSPAFRSRLPVVFAHGTLDSVYPWTKQFSVFKAAKNKDPSYPIQFLLFETGSHGTPIRMIDWRRTLNWIFAKN